MTSGERNPQRWRTAVHEAGHAAMSWRLGRRFAYVTTVDDEVAHGHCKAAEPAWMSELEYGQTLTLGQRRYVESSVMAALAGQETERAWAERGHRRRPAEYSWAHDRDAVYGLTVAVLGQSTYEAEAFTEWLRRRCLVEMDGLYWATVDALATELQPGVRLSYPRAVEIMRASVHAAA